MFPILWISWMTASVYGRLGLSAIVGRRFCPITLSNSAWTFSGNTWKLKKQACEYSYCILSYLISMASISVTQQLTCDWWDYLNLSSGIGFSFLDWTLLQSQTSEWCCWLMLQQLRSPLDTYNTFMSKPIIPDRTLIGTKTLWFGYKHIAWSLAWWIQNIVWTCKSSYLTR